MSRILGTTAALATLLLAACAHWVTHYQVEPGSTANVLVYRVRNQNVEQPMLGLTVSVADDQARQWLTLKQDSVVIPTIPPGATGVARFHYDVDAKAPDGSQGAFRVTARSGDRVLEERLVLIEVRKSWNPTENRH